MVSKYDLELFKWSIIKVETPALEERKLVEQIGIEMSVFEFTRITFTGFVCNS